MKQTGYRREAFTLVELLVVIGIILVIAALAAAFMPRVSDSQNLTRAVDQLEQWLLTAKMRAKHDQLATGIRFEQAQGDPPNVYSQFEYIQQPDPLSGGWLSVTNAPGSVPAPPPYANLYLSGGLCMAAAKGKVQFYNVDFSLGGIPATQWNQWLVQPGDYLEIRDGGVYLIASVIPPPPGQPATTLQLGLPSGPTPYDQALTITAPTTNYRILRQPRILTGEAPLVMPNNFAVDANIIAGTTVAGANVQKGPSGYLEILFSPSGAVIGTNAGKGKLYMYVHDITQNPVDPNRAGIIAVQTRTGFIGAYDVAPGADPFLYAEEGRSSGL